MFKLTVFPGEPSLDAAMGGQACLHVSELPRCARDFASGLKRPQIGSTLCYFVFFVVNAFQESRRRNHRKNERLELSAESRHR